MSWFFFAVGGTALFGLVALTDKYMLTFHFKDPLVYAWVTGVAGGATALLGMVAVALTGGSEPPGGLLAIGLLLSGALLFLAAFAYMRALSRSTVTVVMAYSQLTPVFAFALGFWVLSEGLAPIQILGMVVVMGSAIGLAFGTAPSTEGKIPGGARKIRLVLGAALPLMLVSTVFRAGSDLLLKQRTVEAGVLTAYLVSRQGILLCAMLLLLNGRLRRRVFVGLRATTLTAWTKLAAVEVGAIISFFMLTVALRRGPLALVSVISSNVAVFTLAYAALFGRAFKMPNVPAIGIAWQRLLTCLALMAVGTAALSGLF